MNPQPYSVPQVLANLKEMARTSDLEWIGQLANDIVQRGIEDTNTGLLLSLRNLTDAATLIEERWEGGDLADAVRSLMVDRDNARAALRELLRADERPPSDEQALAAVEAMGKARAILAVKPLLDLIRSGGAQ